MSQVYGYIGLYRAIHVKKRYDLSNYKGRSRKTQLTERPVVW